eukprot:c3389_g1_i1.p1 GENE.c3389_g1_i1~~c3389_g1_i1.p1  ORF type:complete len:254 (-),score=38.11 c3389_g1_i1:532-1191(-)
MYIQRTTDRQHANDWIVYFEGGGWCYSLKECTERAAGRLGSSRGLGPTIRDQPGVLDSDCAINPSFCKFNKVYLVYCDGASFSGLRATPLRTTSPTIPQLHFRGRAILEAALGTLSESYSFRQATQLLLTGCSAGGLAAFMHADDVGQYVASFPNLLRYKVAPISGFFLLRNNVNDVPVPLLVLFVPQSSLCAGLSKSDPVNLLLVERNVWGPSWMYRS